MIAASKRQRLTGRAYVMMRKFNCWLTSLLFVAHCLLGCSAHHALADCPHPCGDDHACLADHHDGPLEHQAPGHDTADHDSAPAPKCMHGCCTYLKVESASLDLDDGLTTWLPLPPHRYDWQTASAGSLLGDLHRASLPEVCPLHLLHCALLI